MHRFFIVIVILALQFIVAKYSFADYSSSLRAYNENNFKLSISECEQLINDSKCLNILGIIYLNGYGVSKDIDKASILFIQSDKLGNSSAKFNLGWMALMGLGEEVNIEKASNNFKLSLKETNDYNTSNNVDEELILESNNNLIKLSKNNFIAKFNLFYTEYLKLNILFLSKINNEKQYIRDISLIEEKLSIYEDNLTNLEVDINDLKLKIKNEQDLLLTLLILNLSSNYIEFERVIKQTYVNLIKINI
jgi:hypothetical protein